MSNEEKSINKEKKQTAEYEYKELPDGWWHELDWILPGREKEPTLYELFHDMMIGSIVGNPMSLEIASKMVPRIILIEIEHPEREVEYVRVMINPTDLKPGIPDTEPDLIIHMLYYDFVRILIGEIDMMAPIWAGNGWIIGNLTCGLDLRDLLAASTDKDAQKRPAMWPLGSP
jgi:putative sterol carrier protein